MSTDRPHAVITGASSGIGAAIARELGAHGWALSLVARRADRLAALADEVDVPCHVVPVDLSDLDQATDWLSGAQAALGPVALLVNNAGVQVIGRTDRVDLDRVEASIRVNLMAPMRLWQAVLPGMLARRFGTIVDIASMAALAPMPGMTWYNAGKGGLAAASEALRGELRGTGVHVVTVYPGIIGDTDLAISGEAAFQQTVALRMQPRGTARVLARRVVRAVERRQDRVIYPWFNCAARWFPGTTRFLMDRFTPPLKEGED